MRCRASPAVDRWPRSGSHQMLRPIANPAQPGMGGDLQPVLKRVVRGVPAAHEAACLPSGALCHRGHRDGVVMSAQALDHPERWFHAVVL